jgi:hypothetical protein
MRLERMRNEDAPPLRPSHGGEFKLRGLRREVIGEDRGNESKEL